MTDHATPSVRADVGGMSPLFIVRDVPATLAFYRDQLGFTVTFEGPEPDDIYFGIVQRGQAMLLMKDVDMDPVPNHTRDCGHGMAPWDAYVYVADPDALAAEFAARGVPFRVPLQVNSDNLRGFEISDPNGYVVYFGRPVA